MERKTIDLEQLLTLCGKNKVKLFEIMDYLSKCECDATEKEIKDGVGGYREKSGYINTHLKTLEAAGLINKIEISNKRYKYQIASREFLIRL